MRYLSLLLCLFALPAFGQVASSFTVGTNSTVVLPTRGTYTAQSWSTNLTAVQGQLFEHESGVRYMALAATNALPAVPSAEFRVVPKAKRVYGSVQNVGAIDVWLSFSEPAVVNTGLRLQPGESVSLKDVQVSVSAVAGAAGALVSTVDL